MQVISKNPYFMDNDLILKKVNNLKDKAVNDENFLMSFISLLLVSIYYNLGYL